MLGSVRISQVCFVLHGHVLHGDGRGAGGFDADSAGQIHVCGSCRVLLLCAGGNSESKFILVHVLCT